MEVWLPQRGLLSDKDWEKEMGETGKGVHVGMKLLGLE